MKPEDFDCRVVDDFCFFTKGPFSQWYGGGKDQEGGFVDPVSSQSFNCAEQWMMVQKATLFRDWDIVGTILQEKSPRKQKALGRQVKNFDPVFWDEHKFGLVKRGNYLKFDQNPELFDFLFSFKESTVFVEAAPWDTVWGIGMGMHDEGVTDTVRWKGQNLLGLIMTQLRTDPYFKNQHEYSSALYFA